MEYVTSVGMEVHAELATRSKMFCRCAVAFGGEPNTRTCPVCLGLPGSLPVPNREAIEMVIKTALALNCQIAMRSVFHRKNYFYPDLPKGYQVSQYGDTNPIGYNGFLELPNKKQIKIRRVHLEEDTGKLIHVPGAGSGIDYNRAGTPLMEIVTEFPPDISTPDEAKDYLTELRQILLYLGVCDGKMEEGSLRCEPNISIRPITAEFLGIKTELKNLNSFRSVHQGVAFEVRRQAAVLDSGSKVAQETRGWNEQKESSYLMRAKEEENDYRYFPDPDLVPMVFDQPHIDELKTKLPELPSAKVRRYQEDLGLSEYEAHWLTSDPLITAYFEEALKQKGDPKAICNWITSDLSARCNHAKIAIYESKVTPQFLVELTQLIQDETINGKTAKAVLAETFESGKSPAQIVKESNSTQITDESVISSEVLKVINQHPDAVHKANSGERNVVGFLVGQVLRNTGGRANPKVVQQLVARAIEEKTD
jgi:aspartyl-tRNA(Asn)/glutamyl-tRNA(Gln) amidotransferase subunit B